MKTEQLLNMNIKMKCFESEEQINEIGITACKEEFW